MCPMKSVAASLLFAGLMGLAQAELCCTAIDPSASDAWCNSMCNYVPPNCPPTLCKCAPCAPTPPPAPTPVAPTPPPSPRPPTPPPSPIPPAPGSGGKACTLNVECGIPAANCLSQREQCVSMSGKCVSGHCACDNVNFACSNCAGQAFISQNAAHTRFFYSTLYGTRCSDIVADSNVLLTSVRLRPRPAGTPF